MRRSEEKERRQARGMQRLLDSGKEAKVAGTSARRNTTEPLAEPEPHEAGCALIASLFGFPARRWSASALKSITAQLVSMNGQEDPTAPELEKEPGDLFFVVG